jgi:hypothetical protein
MHYVTTGNIVAIATAFAAFLTAVSGIVFSWLRIRREVQKWVRERKVELMNERLKVLKQERFTTYPLVMKTLGAVRDVPGPNREHYAALESDPNSLVTVSDELIAHLYAQPGW